MASSQPASAGIKIWRDDVLHFFDQAMGLVN
jgi:hypothetical protein